MSFFFLGVCGLSSLVKFFVKTFFFLAFSNLKNIKYKNIIFFTTIKSFIMTYDKVKRKNYVISMTPCL